MIKSNLPLLLIITLLLLITGCSSIQRGGIGIAGQTIKEASPELLTETDWSFFRSSLPGTLKTTESLLYLKPDDKNLLHTLTKGYAALGMLVHETRMWEKEMKGEDFGQERDEALMAYNKAVAYGFRYLSHFNLNSSSLITATQDETIQKLLNKELDVKDFQQQEVIFFLAQSWAGLINLQKDRPLMIAMLPTAKSLFDWVCGFNANFYHGSCDFFYGTYELSRPEFLGGNPQKGKEIFESAMKRHPQNLLLHLGYIQYVLLPNNDEPQPLEEEKTLLAPLFETFQKEHQQFSFSGEPPKQFTLNDLNLFNTTALRRYQALINQQQK